jgi:hypothetical protein
VSWSVRGEKAHPLSLPPTAALQAELKLRPTYAWYLHRCRLCAADLQVRLS